MSLLPCPALSKLLLAVVLLAGSARTALAAAPVEAPGLRILAPSWLELEWVNRREADPPSGGQPWNLVTPAANVAVPSPDMFAVTVAGRSVKVRAVGFKRRALYAPLDHRDLQAGSWLYLELEQPVPPASE